MTGWVHTAKQRGAPRLKLGRLLGEGAAGKVYSLPGRPGHAAKLYHDEATCRASEAKIDAMLARPPQLPVARHEGRGYPQLAWPEAKLYDATGAFVGFMMPEIDFDRATSLVNLLQRSSRRAEGLADYYGYRLLVARNFASVIAELHRAGHHMIDMKPANLRFYPAVSWVAVVDTDGFSIAGARRRIAAQQVSDEYIAPEGWHEKPEDLGEAQDRFALAAIVFQLLNNGLHPFSGASHEGQPSDVQGRVQAGLYGYGLTPIVGAQPGAASIHRSFRRSTRELFDRAFLSGSDRPSAADWRDHLDALVGMLVPCAAKPDAHAHFGNGCGFCAHQARMAASAARRVDRRIGPPQPVAQGRPPRRIVPAQRRPLPIAGAAPARSPQSGQRHMARAGLILSGMVAPLALLTTLAAASDQRPFQAVLVSDLAVQFREATRGSEQQLQAEVAPSLASLRGLVGAARWTLGSGAVAGRTSPDMSGGYAFGAGAAAGLSPDRCVLPANWAEQQLCASPELASIDHELELRYFNLAAGATGVRRDAFAAQ
jgi:DNA-binding helix-hairpin-helix protein with protein kinase domain